MADEQDKTEETKTDKPWWSEAVKEATLTGIAAIFMTEESVRNYLKEKKLPKELASQVLDGISKRKDDFYGLLVNEFGKVLSKIDISGEISKFLETHEVEVKLSFKKREGGRNT